MVLLFLFLYCRTKAGVGQNFRYSSENSPPVAKSRLLRLFGLQGSFQLPTSTIKKGSPILEADPAARLFQPLNCRFCPISSCKPPIMVRTQGGHRYRPRVQTHSPSRDVAGTSKAAADHSPAQGAEAPPSVSLATTLVLNPASTDIPKEP